MWIKIYNILSDIYDLSFNINLGFSNCTDIVQILFNVYFCNTDDFVQANALEFNFIDIVKIMVCVYVYSIAVNCKNIGHVR